MKLKEIKNISLNTIIGERNIVVSVPFTLKEGVEALKENATSLCAADIVKVWKGLNDFGKADLISHFKANKNEANRLTDWLSKSILFTAKEIRAREHISRKILIAMPSKEEKELARDLIACLEE